jgi:hypothetical protein
MAYEMRFVQAYALWGVAMRSDGEIFKLFQSELKFLEDGGYRPAAHVMAGSLRLRGFPDLPQVPGRRPAPPVQGMPTDGVRASSVSRRVRALPVHSAD